MAASSLAAAVGVGGACATSNWSSAGEAARLPFSMHTLFRTTDAEVCLRRKCREACVRGPPAGAGSRARSRWKAGCRGALLQNENAVPQKQDYYTVGDFMTPRSDLFVVRPSTTVDEALKVLVENRITGMPVVDCNDKLVGVVSDYDLLALDSISGKRTTNNGLFPEAGSTWKAFKEIQKLLIKTHGKTIGEVMSPSPLVVQEMTNLEDAARLLLDSKYRRLPIVDDSGKLVGLLTRGNVVSAALQIKQAGETK